MRTTMRTNRITNNRTKGYKKVSKGVYQYPSGNFLVTKTINGTRVSSWFTKVTPAKNFYKTL